jgi:hypothetical protein
VLITKAAGGGRVFVTATFLVFSSLAARAAVDVIAKAAAGPVRLKDYSKE